MPRRKRKAVASGEGWAGTGGALTAPLAPSLLAEGARATQGRLYNPRGWPLQGC